MKIVKVGDDWILLDICNNDNALDGLDITENI